MHYTRALHCLRPPPSPTCTTAPPHQCDLRAHDPQVRSRVVEVSSTTALTPLTTPLATPPAPPASSMMPEATPPPSRRRRRRRRRAPAHPRPTPVPTPVPPRRVRPQRDTWRDTGGLCFLPRKPGMPLRAGTLPWLTPTVPYPAPARKVEVEGDLARGGDGDESPATAEAERPATGARLPRTLPPRCRRRRPRRR